MEKRTLTLRMASLGLLVALSAATAQGTATISSASSSANVRGFPASNARDGNMGTYYIAPRLFNTLQLTLSATRPVDGIRIAFGLGETRRQAFAVHTSTDGVTWTLALKRALSAGNTDNLERFTFLVRDVRFVRITNLGNTQNSQMSIREVRVDLANTTIGADPDAVTVDPVAVEPTPAPGPTPAPPATDPGEVNVANFGGRRFYVDSSTTVVQASRTGSLDAPFKNVAEVNALDLNPGDGVYFRRGLQYADTRLYLTAGDSGSATAPLVIGHYGTGDLPMFAPTSGAESIRIEGLTHFIIDGVQTAVPLVNRPGRWVKPTSSTSSYNNPDYRWTQTCATPGVTAANDKEYATGWRVGIGLYANAELGTIRNSKMSGHTAGMHVGDSSLGRFIIQNNQFVNNDIISTNTPPVRTGVDNNGNGNVYDDLVPFVSSENRSFWDDDSGGFGLLLNKSDNIVRGNVFSGNNTKCSEDYGVEGAGIEIFNSSRNWIDRNRSIDDGTFIEMGGTSVNNVITYNLFAPLSTAAQKSGEFLVLRAGGNFGGQSGTIAVGNTAYMVQVGVSCGNGCSSVTMYQFRNNVVIGSHTARKRDGYGCLISNNCGANDQKAEYFADGADTDANGTKDSWPLTGNNRFGRLVKDSSGNVITSGTGSSGQWNAGTSRQASDIQLNHTQIHTAWTNALAGDFTLPANSPLIDQGSSAALTFNRVVSSTGTLEAVTLNRDMLGQAVPKLGTNPDIGSVERQ